MQVFGTSDGSDYFPGRCYLRNEEEVLAGRCGLYVVDHDDVNATSVPSTLPNSPPPGPAMPRPLRARDLNRARIRTDNVIKRFLHELEPADAHRRQVG